MFVYSLCGALLIAVLASVTYSTLFTGEWEFISTWDDDGNFLENDLFRGLDWTHICAMWRAVKINVYEPIGWMVKAAVYGVAGLDSRAVRIATLGAHIIASVGLYLLLLRLGRVWRRAQQRESGGRAADAAGALIAACVFAVHPLNVEVICWPSAQPYAVGMVFAIASLLAFTAARWPSHTMDSVEAPLASPLLACSVLCYALAVLSKSVFVTLPVAIVCLEFTAAALHAAASPPSKSPSPSKSSTLTSASASSNLARLAWRFAVRLMPFAVCCVATLWMTIFANKDGALFDSDTISLAGAERITKAASALLASGGRVVWPVNLRPHYLVHEREVQLGSAARCSEVVALLGDAHGACEAWSASIEPRAVFCVAATLLSGVVAVAIAASQPWLLASLVWIVAAFAPTSGLIQHGLVTDGADRYCYLPLLAVAAVLCEFVRAVVVARVGLNGGEAPSSKVELGEQRQHVSIGTRVLLGVCAVIVGLLAWTSAHQTQFWRSDEALWRRSIALDPSDWRALDMYAEWLFKRGRSEEANVLLPMVLKFAPQRGLKPALLRARTQIMLGDAQKACEYYHAAMGAGFEPTVALLNNLAICHLREEEPLAGGVPAATKLFAAAGDIAMTSKSTIQRHKDTLAKNRAELLQWPGLTSGVYYSGNLIF